jgi:hypothetical protein
MMGSGRLAPAVTHAEVVSNARRVPNAGAIRHAGAARAAGAARRAGWTLAAALAVLSLTAGTLPAQTAGEPVDLGMITRLRAEGLSNSQVMETLWWLTDRYGPRLTNSPQQRRAADFAVERLSEWGLSNVAQEPWGEFGLGWSYERCTVELVAPDYMPLIAIPSAWTRGLDAPLRGEPIFVDATSEATVEAARGKLAGRIVLAGTIEDVPSHFEPTAKRHDEASLAELAAAPEPDAPDDREQRRQAFLASRRAQRALNDMAVAEGAAVLLLPDGGRRGDYGVIMLGGSGSRDPAEDRAMPQIVVSTEQWNRVARLLQRGEPVEVAVDVRTTFHDEELRGFNVIAELPGVDSQIGDELVMLGAHFDSWHPGTGATDNGSSSAVVMEAMRILKAVGAKPRRTIRMALWTGEEQGLLGSRGYAEAHFGDRDTMELLPEHERLAAYFNLDNGGGKIRGVYCEDNFAVMPIFAAWLAPFADLGATTLAPRGTGGTDHLSFERVGLPGFQFIQDPMDYSSRTHHTNMDLLERVQPADVRQAATIMAAFAWHAAQRDEKLPRKPLPAAREPRAPRGDAPAPEPVPEVAPAPEPVAEPAAGAAAGSAADGGRQAPLR